MNTHDNLHDMRKKIGQYSYCSKDTIGKGYSSVVYKAQSQSNGHTLALKLIDMKNIKGEVHKTLLNNEMEILRLLNNLQNIIKLHQILPLKTHTCIVTELCDGGDLAKIIKTRKTIPERQSVGILKEIINGYRGINRFGIVHRDLKPANIFFSQGKVKIADFGFAIRNSDLRKASNYNVGSPVYMPLEALNDNQYSSKSDIWAIGVIFYEMLTGHTPWKAKTEADLKRQIKAISIKSLIPTQISRNSSDFLIKALQLNSTLRMSTDQMINYFDRSSESTSDSMASSNLRTNNLFRTRAISQDKEERVGDNRQEISKNTVTAPKSYRKTSRVGDYNGFQRPNEIPKMAFDHTGFEKLGQQHKLGSLARTTAGLGQDWIPDHKKTSAQLLSQIHFCRFFYKLIERMQKLSVGSDKLKVMMATIINGKFKEIKQLSIINTKYAIIFQRTKQCERIHDVIDQYVNKYGRILEWTENESYGLAFKEIQDQITCQILTLYDRIKSNDSFEGHQQEIILLDYLITTKQLILINSKKDIEYFHRKSKIEAIVQGRPAKNITQDHFDAIIHKLRIFKMIV